MQNWLKTILKYSEQSYHYSSALHQGYFKLASRMAVLDQVFFIIFITDRNDRIVNKLKKCWRIWGWEGLIHRTVTQRDHDVLEN